MALLEIDSFVLKFKNLLLAGVNANLTINSQAGKAILTLTAEVDVPPLHPRHVGAARLRRRERRAAERETNVTTGVAGSNPATEEANPNLAAEEAVSDSDVEDNITEEVIEKDQTTNVKATEKVNEIEDTEIVEEKELGCDKCAFVGKTSAGLKTHQTTVHRKHRGGKSLFTIIWWRNMGEFLPPLPYLGGGLSPN